MNNTRHVRGTSWVCGVLVLLIMTASSFSSAEDIPRLFIQPDNMHAGGQRSAQRTDTHVSVRTALLNPSAGSPAVLRADLPDGTVVIRKKDAGTHREGSWWSGTVDGEELSSAVFTTVKGVTFGRIDRTGRSYSIEPDGMGHTVRRNDAAGRIPHDEGPKVPPAESGVKGASAPLALSALPAEDGSRIDVLVLYTQQMVNRYGAGLSAKIQSLIDIANTSYRNSGVNTQLNLARAELLADPNVAEGVDIDSALDAITFGNTQVSALRETWKADMVTLLRAYQGSMSCGLAWIMQSTASYSSSYMFSVVEVGSYGGYFCEDTSFAHELGHNMGCDHDWNHGGGNGIYSYSNGHDVAGIFGTIMSYDGPTVLYFSNPNLFYSGYPLGIPEGQPNAADNARTINTTRIAIANFKVAIGGSDKIGLFRDGLWSLDANGDRVEQSPPTDRRFVFGQATDSPVSGDWNGNGVSGAGVFRSANARFILDMNDNGVFEAGTDVVFIFGRAGDIPISGDWNGSGSTKIGVFRGGKFIIDVNGDRIFTAGVDASFNFGLPTDIPVTGDWNGGGTTKVGVFRAGRFILDLNGDRVFTPGVDTAFNYGLATDIPVAGDWNGDGVIDVGVFSPATTTWTLDSDGDRALTPADATFVYGAPGGKPLSGAW